MPHGNALGARDIHIHLQDEWVLARLDVALRKVGSDLARVFNAQVFLTDLNDFAILDDAWRAL
ncbi:Rid family hydrolase [Variovorax sp. V213]|uniref:Rid family hydrolase n=1 Tax=Variovorax sp. V213 TaxID=3065955 RepID=UPI0034E869B9